MRILIIEDEKHTAQRLVQLIMEIKKDAQIVAVLNSVESSLLWFRNNEEPDLIFRIFNWEMGFVLRFMIAFIFSHPLFLQQLIVNMLYNHLI
jgi:two-component SAPR family response regulator